MSPRNVPAFLFALVTLGFLPPTVARAQPYARFAVPDTALDDSLRANHDGFENLWNALLVSWLRARVAGTDSSGRLAALAERIAAAEPRVLGTRNAAEALQNFRDRPRTELEIRLRAGLAEARAATARRQDDDRTADILNRAALADYRQVGERRRAAWVLGSLGATALEGGRYTEAESLLTEALSARRALDDQPMIGNSLYDLGQTYYRLRRYETARDCLEESRQIRERTGQTAQLGSTLQFLGVTLAALGQTDSAWVCFERGIAFTSEGGDSVRTLGALQNYSKVLGSQGFVERALALQRRALVIAEQLDLPDRVEIHASVADALRQAGRFTEALEYSLSWARQCETPGREPELAHALNSIGRLWLALGDPRPARAPLARARALADSLGDGALRTTILVNLSWAEQLRGAKAGAWRHGTHAMAAAIAAGDSSLVRDAAAQLGDLAIAQGRLGEAERFLSRALANAVPGDPEMRANDLTQLALARQLAGRLDEAERDLGEAVALAERIRAPEIASTAWLNLGDIAERRGGFSTAIERYSRALDLIDTLRARQRSESEAITAFASRLAPYEAVIHLLGKLDASSPDSGYAARAFYWAERARARALLDRVVRPGGGAPRPATIGEAQALLPSPRSALLHYSVGDSSTSLWVIRPEGWRLHRLAPRRELADLVRAFRVGISTPDGAASAAFRDAQRRLYARLIAPADSMLTGVDELVIVPDGPLAQLPFEALRGPARPGDGSSYLVERFAVSYVPSASLLGVLDHASPSPEIVAIGDPYFGRAVLPPAALRGIGGVKESAMGLGVGSPALAPLPGSGRELKALEEIGQGRRVVILSGRAASRSRLLGLPELADAAIIHIATHAVAHELEPTRSGMWLAAEPGSETAGFLAVPDVARLRLHASLVTLSACETGLGPIERGEGVLGLARAFLEAGARSVVVSQWRVADRATAVLMERFYRALLVEGRTRAQALAEAKRALLRREATRSPHLWAPFVLIGRSGPLE